MNNVSTKESNKFMTKNGKFTGHTVLSRLNWRLLIFKFISVIFLCYPIIGVSSTLETDLHTSTEFNNSKYPNGVNSDELLVQNQRKVTGVITDGEGLPVPGVNIIVEGTTKGIVTDFNGAYEIGVNQGDRLVLFKILYFT